MVKKLLFVVNVDWFFCSHRLPIAVEALKQGFEVHVATKITSKQEELEALGFVVHPLKISRGYSGVVKELAIFISILTLLLRLKPDLVHFVTIKPILYGGIASRFANVPSVVMAVSGLGYVFIKTGVIARVMRMLAAIAYRIALNQKRIRVVFQNDDDRNLLCDLANLKPEDVVILPGSGVDLSVFKFTPEPDLNPVVVMISRLLSDKGVVEFAEAAHILKEKGVVAKFQLVGEIDPENPASLSDDVLKQWKAKATLDVLGHRENIACVLSGAHIVVLPSYREGFPKVLIEASAAGRPIVTTDVPGCRDAILPDESGLLVPAKDSHELAKAILRLVEDKSLRLRMGVAGRNLAVAKYSIESIVEKHMKIYRELLV